MSAGHGNSYSTKMIRRTFWGCLVAAFVVMIYGGVDGVVYHDGIPQWVGTMFWFTLAGTAFFAAVRALFNKI